VTATTAQQTAVAAELHQRIQPAGKQILINLFSLMKTGEIHDLNNDAYLRPTEKLAEALEIMFKLERQAITVVVYEGVVQINSHALWLDPATQEVTQELEQWLARRESGGIIFSSRPTDDEVRRFFYHFARFRAPADTKNQFGALAAHLTADGITRLKLAPQPVRLEGVGQGVRGVATLWHYAKACAGLNLMLQKAPVDMKQSRRLALELVDACAAEQDIMTAAPLLGRAAHGPARRCVDLAILAAGTARALGLSAVRCGDVAQAVLLHEVGGVYPNPDPTEFTVAEASATLAVRQLLEAQRFTPELAARVSVGIEHGLGPTRSGPPYLASAPAPILVSQLLIVAAAWLDLVRGREDRTPVSALEAGLTLLRSPPRGVEPALTQVFVATVGLLPVGTVVELHNHDVGVVADVEHLRGRSLYGAEPAPITAPRKIWIERMRTARGEVVPERQSRVCLGATTPDGDDWAIRRTLSSEGWTPVILRALLRRPSTVVMQLGLRT
jgi:hypothetical protein